MLGIWVLARFATWMKKARTSCASYLTQKHTLVEARVPPLGVGSTQTADSLADGQLDRLVIGKAEEQKRDLELELRRPLRRGTARAKACLVMVCCKLCIPKTYYAHAWHCTQCMVRCRYCTCLLSALYRLLALVAPLVVAVALSQAPV